MDKTDVSRQVVVGQRRRESEMESKVPVRSGELLKVVFVEHFLSGTRAIPETDFASSALVFEQVSEVGAERGHARTAADIDHLALCRLDMKVSKWANARNHVARFQMKNKARSDSWRAVLTGRRCRDPDIEAECSLRLLVGRKRIIVAPVAVWIAGHQIKHTLIPPDRGEGLGNVEIAEADRIVRGDVELNVIARCEGNRFAGIHGFEDQFLDERGDVFVADHLEPAGLLRARANSAGTRHIDAEAALALLHRIGSKSAANGCSRG